VTERNAAYERFLELRREAAEDLIRATDTMNLLGKINRATGGAARITPADTDRLRLAQQRWERVA
jgi:hypothetical protein